MNIQASKVRRWQEESQGIYRNVRGQFTAKKNRSKNTKTKVVEVHKLNIWIGLALSGWAIAAFLFVAVDKLAGLCVAS